MLLAGASILAVVVGAALIGRDPSRDARATVVSTSASATADSGPVPAQPEVLVHGRTAGATPHVIVLEWPATQFEAATSGDLVVRGHLLSGTGPVLVVLETSGGATITGKTVGPMTMPRPGVDPAPPFEVRLALPDPRPAATMTLEVIAYDINGIPVDAIRRPIRIAGAAGDPFPKP